MTSSSLRTAHALWRAGRLQEAAIACGSVLTTSPRDPEALHLLGLIRKDSGALTESEQLLRTSVALAPTRTEFLANLGNLLLRLTRIPEAVETYRSALALDPGHRPARFGLARSHAATGSHAAAQAELRMLLASNGRDAQAWSALADSLREEARFAEAEAAFRQALSIAPDRTASRHNFGSLLSHLGRAEEAIEELDRAARLGLRGRELLMNRARALLQLYRVDEAEDAFASAVRADPRDADAQRELAQLRFMRGDPSYARDALAAAGTYRGDPRLQMLVADILRRTGELQHAETALRDLLMRTGELPEARAALATVLHEMRRLEDAETEALLAVRARPEDDVFVENLVAIRLARGHPDQAAPFIEAQRTRSPLDQRWIAYQAAAARLRGDPLYRELCDYDRLVRVFDLHAPPGWTERDFGDALTAALTQRHVFARHPLSLSLRNGSQTARSLLRDSHPAIRAVLAAFSDPIAQYQVLIGNDLAHPLTARNRGPATLSGCWSVQLHRAGFHCNHIHPQGWISSAFYVSVPGESDDAALKRGWLKFGETSLGMPGDAPEHFVQPRVGRLVLFPSYMWHGTIPIESQSPRMTIAFDAVPPASTHS